MGSFFQNEFNQVVKRFLIVAEPCIFIFSVLMAMASGRIGTFFGIFFVFNLILGLIYLGLLLVIWILWGSGDN